MASGVNDALLESISARATRVVRLGADRYTFDLALDPPPDRVLAELSAGGAALVSLNPLRDTLEDLFVQNVTGPGAPAGDRGLGTPASSSSVT